MKKLKIVAWTPNPFGGKNDEKVMYDRTKIGFALKKFYCMCLYDYLEILEDGEIEAYGL